MNLPETKKLIIVPVLLFGVAVGGYQALAVYPVHDAKE